MERDPTITVFSPSRQIFHPYKQDKLPLHNLPVLLPDEKEPPSVIRTPKTSRLINSDTFWFSAIALYAIVPSFTGSPGLFLNQSAYSDDNRCTLPYLIQQLIFHRKIIRQSLLIVNPGFQILHKHNLLLTSLNLTEFQ